MLGTRRPHDTQHTDPNVLFSAKASVLLSNKWNKNTHRVRIERKHATADNGEINNFGFRYENEKNMQYAINMDRFMSRVSMMCKFTLHPSSLCILINSIGSCYCCYGHSSFNRGNTLWVENGLTYSSVCWHLFRNSWNFTFYSLLRWNFMRKFTHQNFLILKTFIWDFMNNELSLVCIFISATSNFIILIRNFTFISWKFWHWKTFRIGFWRIITDTY